MTKTEQIYADVLEKYPDAEIAVREEKALHFSLGQKRIGSVWSTEHLLVSSLGVLHYDDGTGWKDFKGIVKVENKDGFVFRTDLGGFTVLFREDGSRRMYPRSEVLDEYIDIAVPEYFEKSSWAPMAFDSYAIDDQSVTYASGANANLIVYINPRQMKVNVAFLDESTWRSAAGIRFPFALVGLVLNEESVVSVRNNVVVSALPVPYGIDGDGYDMTLGKVAVSDTGVEIAIDISKSVFPVTIDPTLTVAIAASGDDGWHDNSNLYSSGISAAFGSTTASGYFRYQVNLAQGTTILTSVIDAYSGGIWYFATDPVVNIYACAEDNSAQIASVADYNSRALTGAFVTWTAVVSSTPLVAVTTDDFGQVVQEVVSRGGFVANNYIQILFKSNDTNGTQRSFRTIDYNGGSHVSQLSIGYSTVVSRVIPVVCV